MVHAEELMLSDYILYHDSPRKVIILGNNGMIGTTLDGENVVTKEKFYSYIPLTENLMEKLGFKLEEDVGGFSISMNLNGYRLEINTLSNSKDKKYYLHIDNLDHQTVGGCDLNDLHELQQLVRLVTKQELEVKSWE